MGNLQGTAPHFTRPLCQPLQALLEHNAKVYLAARSEDKAKIAIDKLKEETGQDRVHFLKLDLGNLPSCADAAHELAVKESKLDILFLNAYFPSHSICLTYNRGVMIPPTGSKTESGYEMQWVPTLTNLTLIN
jgi:retinol dehydrogenase-12